MSIPKVENSQYYKLVVPPCPNPDRVMGNCDRHIPSREAMRQSHAFETCHLTPPQSDYQQALTSTLFPNYSENILQFNPPKECKFKHEKPKPPKWVFPIKPSKTIKTPGAIDNFYSNNLDWGSRNHLLGVGVGKVCYILSREKNKPLFAMDSQNPVRSLKWSPSGTVLAIGDSRAGVFAYDVIARQYLFGQCLHTSPLSIASVNWRSEKELTIAPFGNITHYDIGSDTPAWSLFRGGAQICSLEWSPDNSLLARGGNDNKVEIFDIRRISDAPVFSYSHEGAIKGLKWMPNSSFLFSGGGSGDRMIKLFNAKNGNHVCEADAEAQVCSIEYLSDDTIVSGCGHPESGLQFWKFDPEKSSLKKIHQIFFNGTGGVLNPSSFAAASRVLNVSKDPNGLEFSSISSKGLQIWELNPLSTQKSFLSDPKWTIR